MTDGGIALRVFQAMLVVLVLYLGWHLWLAFGLHQTPDQFIADVRRQFQEFTQGLMPNINRR